MPGPAVRSWWRALWWRHAGFGARVRGWAIGRARAGPGRARSSPGAPRWALALAGAQLGLHLAHRARATEARPTPALLAGIAATALAVAFLEEALFGALSEAFPPGHGPGCSGLARQEPSFATGHLNPSPGSGRASSRGRGRVSNFWCRCPRNRRRCTASATRWVRAPSAGRDVGAAAVRWRGGSGGPLDPRRRRRRGAAVPRLTDDEGGALAPPLRQKHRCRPDVAVLRPPPTRPGSPGAADPPRPGRPRHETPPGPPRLRSPEFGSRRWTPSSPAGSPPPLPPARTSARAPRAPLPTDRSAGLFAATNCAAGPATTTPPARSPETGARARRHRRPSKYDRAPGRGAASAPGSSRASTAFYRARDSDAHRPGAAAPRPVSAGASQPGDRTFPSGSRATPASRSTPGRAASATPASRPPSTRAERRAKIVLSAWHRTPMTRTTAPSGGRCLHNRQHRQ